MHLYNALVIENISSYFIKKNIFIKLMYRLGVLYGSILQNDSQKDSEW